MNSLLYKEYKLNIHPLFYLVPLLSGLILIPSWLYFIAMCYVFFISITNIMAVSKAQNDLGYCAMLPIRKRDIVKARILSIVGLELLQIAAAVIFAVLNNRIYKSDNFFLEPNIAFFGFVFIMYGIFNIIFFTMFYKTGHKLGLPSIFAIGAAVIFATIVEMSALLVPQLKWALDSNEAGTLIWKLATLAVGIVVFVATGMMAHRISAKRFEKLDL